MLVTQVCITSCFAIGMYFSLGYISGKYLVHLLLISLDYSFTLTILHRILRSYLDYSLPMLNPAILNTYTMACELSYKCALIF